MLPIAQFLPNGQAYLWNVWLITLQVGAGLLVAGAFLLIPIILADTRRLRPEIPFNSTLWAVVTTFAAAGLYQLLEIWNIWQGDYWISGGLKALTGVAAVAAIAGFIRLKPKIAAMPTHAQIQEITASVDKRVERITHDIQKSNAELKASEERARTMADALPDLVWTARADGMLDYFNKKWFDYTGLTLDQSKDWGWRSVVHSDDAKACTERWTRSFGGSGNFEAEYRIKKADGSFRWHLGRAVADRDAGGKILRWTGYCTDIHDQRTTRSTLETKLAERGGEIAAMEKRLGILLDHAPVLIGYVDREEKYRVTNLTYKDWYGTDPKTFIGRSLRDAHGEKAHRLLKPHIDRALNGDPAHFEDIIAPDASTKRDVVIEYVPDVDKDGAALGFYIIGVDKSEEHIALQQIAVLKSTISSKSKEVQDFAHIVSRDLKDPVHAIIDHTQALEKQLNGSATPELKETVGQVRSSGIRMRTFMQALIGYSEMNAAKYQPKMVDLNEVLRFARTDLQGQLKETGGCIECLARLPVVEGDAAQLRTLFLHIIGNGLKFRKPGVQPEVTIAAEEVSLSGNDEGKSEIRITVTDNGIGFDQKYATQIFEPFKRLQAECEGIGLSLATSKRIVENHGGEISAVGSPSKGATFTFSLVNRIAKTNNALVGAGS